MVGRTKNLNKIDPYGTWLLHWSPSQCPRNAYDVFPLIEASFHRTMEGKVPLWLVAVLTGTRQLEIIWNLNQTISDKQLQNIKCWEMNAFDFFPLIEASSHRTMEGKVPLLLVAVLTGTRQLEIIWNLNQTISDKQLRNIKCWEMNILRWENRQAFSFAHLELHGTIWV